MDTLRICKQCRVPLPVDSPGNLCPACAHTGTTASSPTPASPQLRDENAPPALAEMAAHFPQLEILGVLGQGGMGVVYKARQPNLDRVVALKILAAKYSTDDAFAKRFQREARALAKLNHPNIVSIFDFGQAGPHYFFLMEFVDGMSLAETQRTRRLTPEEALAVVPKICEALQYAHDEGVVHRDIKPGNILLDRKGRVKIADFGLAKLLDQEAPDTTLTTSGLVMGTPRYMAPEQMETPDKVDHRADIYSLGVVFYEMLTGEVPMGRFAPPSQKVKVDARLDEVVLHSLERDVKRRYQRARDIKTDVESISGVGEYLPRHGSWWARQPWVFKNAVGIAAVGAVLGVLIFANKPKQPAPAQQSAKVTKAPVARPVTAPEVVPQPDQLARWQKVLDEAGIRRRLTQGPGTSYELDLTQAGVVDLTPLKGMPLSKLILTGCANLSDLEPLRGMSLEELRVSRTKVADLSPLKGMKLTRFQAAVTPLKDLTPLAGMPLEYVDIQSSQVTDISPLKGMKLGTLLMVSLRVSDFSILKGMPLVTLSASQLDNLSLIADAPLEMLTIVECPTLKDLSLLKDKKLTQLNIGGASVSDLSPLKGMPLRLLGMRGCPVRDLSPLSGMSIERLRLEATLVADLRPLATMSVIELILQGCTEVRDVTPLAQCRGLELLSLPANAENLESLRQISTLKRLAYPAEDSPSINWQKATPVDQFWKDFDARRTAKAK